MQVFTPVLHIRALFTTRHGGVSDGDYASLNTSFSTQDARENVEENRNRIRKAMQANLLCTVSQTHSSKCVDALDTLNRTIEADGLVTDQPGLALGVMGADCTPILFFDKSNQVIGAAHAGWKGALSGIIEATVQAMRNKGAQNIDALIGPCIGPKSYQVDAAFRDHFMDHDPSCGDHFTASPMEAHYMFDLPAYCKRRIEAAGAYATLDHWRDTYSHADDYFSHRRMTHDKRHKEGRQMSVIGLFP